MIKKLLLFIVFLVVIALISLVIFISPLVKYAVNNYGTTVLKTPISLSDANINLLKGAVELNGLKIGEGTVEEVKVNKILVDIDVNSLFTNVLSFEVIQIDGAAFNYSFDGSSNVSSLLEKAQKEEGTKQYADKQDKEAEEVKIYIQNLDVTNSVVTLSGQNGENMIEIPFPDLRMKEIGDPETGITVMEASIKIGTQLSLEIVKAMQRQTTETLKKGIQEQFNLGDTLNSIFN